ncbi:hypothetical protein ATI61_10591 [Archangium gephyra]|uniref:Uncharacterized protein n=1 Tax=Archangium gephyra TaxID=48 RepID=A0AAC8TJQ1_9BACT|nr:hypothetical protein [Archangium gephyra]AKJ06946.1 Hypothetical protein AA314_08572 [Archangium gephyra]REG31767.1 hypothetical protein ATI61_10591 [Archangium gephyra]
MAELPKRFQMEEEGKHLVISWRWFSWTDLLGFVFLFMQFGAFPLYCYGQTFVHEPSMVLEWSWLQIIFTLLHLALVFWMVYWMLLANLLNTTRIQVSGSQLLIRHGPIPTLKNHTLARREISQLYGQNPPGKGTKFWLMAKTRSNGTVQLLTGLDKEQVLYLEKTLENRLDIKNRHMGDEEDGIVSK